VPNLQANFRSSNKIVTFAANLISAKQIAELLNGEIVGDENSLVSDISRIEEGRKGTISFLSNPKYEKFIYSTNASIVLVNKTFEPTQKIKSTLIKVDDSYESVATLLSFYDSVVNNKQGISKQSFISESTNASNLQYLGEFSYIGENVKIGKNVKIYPQVYVGDNVILGDNVTLHAGAKIYHGTIMGNNCVVNAGSVIGGDGFGFAPNGTDYKRIPQVGNVILEDNVDVGANATIDRATMGSTIIRKGVKIDNLVQIAHNVEVDTNTVIAAQTGVSGSTKIGKNVMVAGQVGFAGHLTIGDNAKFAAQSGIANNIAEGTVNQGAPAYNLRDFQKAYIFYKRLPQTNDRVEALENELKELKEIVSKLTK